MRIRVERAVWLFVIFLVIKGLQGFSFPFDELQPLPGSRPPLGRIEIPIPGARPPGRVEMGTVAPGVKTRAELLSLTQVWSEAPNNAFTDLIRFRDRWYCSFREGSSRTSNNGSLRVISSPDGKSWTSSTLIGYPEADLRDPKLSLTPDHRLMLSAAMFSNSAQDNLQSLAWYSLDGRDWGAPYKIGDPGIWMWRVSWHRGNAYSMGYSVGQQPFLRLYTGPEGLRFQTVSDKAYAEATPTEATLLFANDDTALCLLRRDGGTGTAYVGHSRPPYRAWNWRDLGVRLAGPNLLRLPDGRLVAAGLLDNGRPHTSLCWLDPKEATVTEFLPLPSAVESGYPGLVWYDRQLWVSYHSSHEGKSAIYLAQVRVPESE